MSEQSVKDIDQELDELTIRILKLMNDNIKCKLDIERAVRSGCLDLAKTRYILGSTHRVSAMAIPSEEMSATTTVISTTEEGNIKFELQKETENKDSSDKPKTRNQDPLKWFGVLVPQNLRQGQAWFSKAIDYSVQSANIAADICASMDKFEKLKSTKMTLLNKAEE